MDKKDLKDALNELLGLNISWDKLPREDLEQLLSFLNDDKRVLDTLGREMLKERVDTKMDNVFKRLRTYKEASGKGSILMEILGK